MKKRSLIPVSSEAKRKTVSGLLSLLLALAILAVIPAGAAMADQADPDSTPTVEIDVYRNLLETGDTFFLIYANIPYAATPDEPVNESFVFRLIDTDGTTELGQNTGYPYVDDGYGYNVYSMYFSAADNLTWGAAYTIRLSGNPTIFDDPPVYNYPVDSTDYSSLTVTYDVQVEMSIRIMAIANSLDIEWGLGSSYSLLYESEVGTVLSIYGEAFFRNAIYGLQALCPQIFRFAVGDVEVTDRTYDEEYAGNLSSQYAGTWVETAQQGGAALAGTSYDWMTVMMVIVIVVLAIFGGMALAAGDFWSGAVDGIIVMVSCARLGFFELAAVGLVTGMAWVYISGKMWSVWR